MFDGVRDGSSELKRMPISNGPPDRETTQSVSQLKGEATLCAIGMTLKLCSQAAPESVRHVTAPYATNHGQCHIRFWLDPLSVVTCVT